MRDGILKFSVASDFSVEVSLVFEAEYWFAIGFSGDWL